MNSFMSKFFSRRVSLAEGAFEVWITFASFVFLVASLKVAKTPVSYPLLFLLIVVLLVYPVMLVYAARAMFQCFQRIGFSKEVASFLGTLCYAMATAGIIVVIEESESVQAVLRPWLV